MNHKGTVKLETERLILRRFTGKDAQSVFDNWASDSEVTKFLTWPAHQSVKQSVEFMNYCINGYSKDHTYQWGMEIKETGELIGNISVVKYSDEVESVELGWAIGRKWWGQGYTPEAAGVLLEFFFNEVKVNRVGARFDPRNVNSGKVMQKIGMKYEGTLRQCDRNNQGIVDCSYYSILREEYNSGSAAEH